MFNKVKECIVKLPSKERICALKMDEIHIKDYEEYSKGFDCVEGLVDLEHLGRTDERAKYAFVLCLDSLNAKNRWRQTLAYFLPGKSGMNGEQLKLIVQLCLKKLKELGANVKILTSDQCTNNQNAFKLLGITETDSWFEVDGELYCGMADFPHLIKRLFAMLKIHDKIYIKSEVIVCFEDFINALVFDRSRLLSHITDAYLNPNAFESMNVLRAMQVFSRRFVAQDPNGIKSSTWKNSADFAEKLDTVIDLCNAYHLQYGESRKKTIISCKPRSGKSFSGFC